MRKQEPIIMKSPDMIQTILKQRETHRDFQRRYFDNLIQVLVADPECFAAMVRKITGKDPKELTGFDNKTENLK